MAHGKLHIPAPAAEPADSARRMYCRQCHAMPGEKCTKQGKEVNLYCKARWSDFGKLQKEEERLKEWNQMVGKAETK
jgi:hypothetical protein